jgi:hypothetical protein
LELNHYIKVPSRLDIFNPHVMKILRVPYLKTISTETSIESVAELVETTTIETHTIDCINWFDEYPEKPVVHFKFVRIEDGLLIKFYVKEDVTRATFTIDNQPVYRDSCVELFIDPSGDGTYYNFEFSAIGTLLLAFGVNRHDRENALSEITNSVKRLSSIGIAPFDNLRDKSPWHLTVMIPYTSFWRHSLLSLEGKGVRGNFQKCGDDLPVPHYLTWNPIPTPHPDYHKPEYFGIFDFI